MNKISQEEHVAYSIAMGVTLGHGLLYCTANSLISKSDSTKYWAIIIAQTDRYLGDNPDSQRNFREILRNEIQDSEVLYAFDNAINAGGLDILYQDQKDFPLEYYSPFLHSFIDMQQSLIIITKPLSEIQDIALQESWPVFLSFTHNTAQIANCTTDQEESEFAIILAFAFALWIRDFKSFLETKSLTSTIFHKKDTRDEIMIRATFGSGFFAGLYISWSKYLVASNATQPNSEASTKVNLSPG